jgi:hypothetical protein
VRAACCFDTCCFDAHQQQPPLRNQDSDAFDRASRFVMGMVTQEKRRVADLWLKPVNIGLKDAIRALYHSQ